MKNTWKWILAAAALAAVLAGAVTAIILYRKQVLALFTVVKEQVLSKVLQAKDKCCAKRAIYTEDELADFADV